MPDPEPKETSATAVPLQCTRSTPLRPTIWMTGVLVWATVIAFLFQVPVWAGIFLCSVTGLSFLLYLVSYIYLMATDRDALRRERYSVKELPGRELVLPKDAGQDPASGQQPPVGLATQPLSHEAAILSKESIGKAARAQAAASDKA
jgi:hypothetical protein